MGGTKIHFRRPDSIIQDDTASRGVKVLGNLLH